MKDPQVSSKAKPQRSIARRCYDVLSGFGLATILLLLLGLLTWFATLEQVEHGLHATLRKYFNWKSLFLIPEIKGKMVPLPLPGGYWVCALLTLNLTLGGIVRARKGWKHAGNLIAHSGIILMLVAGGVAHHFEVRGNMRIWPGEANDAAEAYQEYVVEITEVDEAGEPAKIHVIGSEHVMDLTGGKSRVIRLPDLPFDLELAGYVKNSMPVHHLEDPPSDGERVVDGYYLKASEANKEAPLNLGGVYARVINKDGSKSDPFILFGHVLTHPYTVDSDGSVYAVKLRKRVWPVPLTIRLDQFTAEFYPNTRKPEKFISEVTRIQGETESQYTIRMNQPLRHEGLTFYQASWGPQNADPNKDELFTVLEVVTNPADQWPKYALYIVTVGLLVAFVTKLINFLIGQSRKRPA